MSKLQDIPQQGTLGRLARSGAISFLVRASELAITSVTTVVLSRVLGASGYGLYSYVFSWATLIGTLAVFGQDRLLVREIAVYLDKGDWSLLRGVTKWAINVVATLSVTLLVGASIWLLYQKTESDQFVIDTLSVALMLIPVLSLGKVVEAVLRGLGFVVLAQVPLSILWPLATLVGVGTALILIDFQANAYHMVMVRILAGFVSLIVACFLLWRMRPIGVRTSIPTYEASRWWSSSFHLWLVGGMYLINQNLDMIMLGSMRPPGEVGIYAVASRVAFLIYLITTATNNAIGPTIAKLYSSRRLVELQSVLSGAVRASLFAAVAILSVYCFLGETILGIFGAEFRRGYGPLLILAVGLVVTIGVGPVVHTLSMIGYERELLYFSAFNTLVNACLNYFLIPQFGVMGAAVASAGSAILKHLALAIFARAKTGLNTSILHKLGRLT